jgi:hypothetical protein
MATLRESRNTWARLMAQLGVVFLNANGDDETSARLASLERDGKAAGLTSIQAYARFGFCLNAALSGDDTRLRQARSDLAAWSAGGDFRWLVAIVDFWLDPAPPDSADFSGSDWLGGTTAARERWRHLLDTRWGGDHGQPAPTAAR